MIMQQLDGMTGPTAILHGSLLIEVIDQCDSSGLFPSSLLFLEFMTRVTLAMAKKFSWLSA